MWMRRLISSSVNSSCASRSALYTASMRELNNGDCGFVLPNSGI
jgi:hypothetical protein